MKPFTVNLLVGILAFVLGIGLTVLFGHSTGCNAAQRESQALLDSMTAIAQQEALISELKTDSLMAFGMGDSVGLDRLTARMETEFAELDIRYATHDELVSATGETCE